MLNAGDVSLARKTEEILLAAQLTQKYEKSKILWYYLNSVPYGNQAIGAEAAAETYFSKPASRVNLREAAVLAGLPQAPSLYDPIHQLARVKARQAVVIAAMVRAGYLTPAEADAARASRTALDP
jgi:membrane peptidoglycan carboxypeptidase